MASNKLTFDFGQPPNFDGLAEQKLIAHSVNVESLADGSGVRTRSGMRHAYQFRQYTNQMSDATQIISGLRTPNAENINSNELGIDIIYAVDDNGKYIIKDMKQTTFIQTEDQYVTFTHVKDPYISYPQILVYSNDNINYYLMLNRLSGSKKVVVNYCIGQISYEGQVVQRYDSIANYTTHPYYQNTNNDKMISGILEMVDSEGVVLRQVPAHSMVGSAILNTQNSFIKIPIAKPNAIIGEGVTPLFFSVPITMSFDCYNNDLIDKVNYVRTDTLKIYVISNENTVDSPVILTNQDGQSNLVYFDRIYPRDFSGNSYGGGV